MTLRRDLRRQGMHHLTIDRFPGRTVPALLCDAARRLPDKVFLHFVDPAVPGAEPRAVTFAAFREGAGRAAALLEAVGVGAGDRVLLLAENSPEWQMLALGAQLLRAEPAAVFASLAAEPAQAVALRVRPTAIFVSTAGQWEKLAPAGAELAAAGLRLVICGEPLAPASLPPGVRSSSLAALGAGGTAALEVAEIERRAAAVGGEDPFLLLFTSGTTGRPKGFASPSARSSTPSTAAAPPSAPPSTTWGCTSSPSPTWPATTSSSWRWRTDTPWS